MDLWYMQFEKDSDEINARDQAAADKLEAACRTANTLRQGEYSIVYNICIPTKYSIIYHIFVLTIWYSRTVDRPKVHATTPHRHNVLSHIPITLRRQVLATLCGK